jgi:hypothetical protein
LEVSQAGDFLYENLTENVIINKYRSYRRERAYGANRIRSESPAYSEARSWSGSLVSTA